MVENLTVFFVKPADVHRSGEITKYLEDMLIQDGDFKIEYRDICKTTPEFWIEFYSHLPLRGEQKALERLVSSYSTKRGGIIDLSLYSGEDIADRVEIISGQKTKFEENPKWTIRGHFGPYERPDTIVHASSYKEVSKDLLVLWNHQLIPIDILDKFIDLLTLKF